MIPILDIYLKNLVSKKVEWIKQHPDMIPRIFGTLGLKTTLPAFTDFVVKRDIKTLLGFPREPQSLPCYVITLASEQEFPIGLGDDIDDFEEPYDETDIETQYVKCGVYFNQTFRIECWSDNGDLTAYMYILLKWCILSAREEMLANGMVEPTTSGGDLEPVPDYFPMFVFRRALTISFKYENEFFANTVPIGDDPAQLPISFNVKKDLHIKSHSFYEDEDC